MKDFQHPAESFGGASPDSMAAIAALAGDLCLVLDGAGIVRDLSFSSDELPASAFDGWVGRPLASLVPADSRPKLEELMRAPARPARWRQINFTGEGTAPLMLQCVVQPLPSGRGALLIGRSLQAVTQMQQRLVQAQQAMERDYWQFRDAETRYRQLFQASSEGVLVLDAESLKVLESNPSACRMLETDDTLLVGRPLPECFGPEAGSVLALLATVRSTGHPAEGLVRLGTDRAEVGLAAAAFRQGGSTHLLVRLVRHEADAARGPSDGAGWLELVGATPDGLVITDGDGRVVAANGAFLELVQLGAEEQLRGESLDQWLGRSGVDLSVLLSNLRQRGIVRLFATRLRGALGASTEVEISAVQLSESPVRLGFAARDVGRRLSASGTRGLQEIPKSVEQLADLVGRVPMKDIVGETSDLIEQLCIEAALDLTRGNRAAAAEMLGLSRQSLYVKLRRFGLRDLGIEDEK